MSRATRSAGDQIEFLAPRESLFGGQSPAEFAGLDVDDLPPIDDTAPRAGWLSGAAALAVTALVAVGVVAAAPWSSADPNVAPPPTTIPPPDTGQISPAQIRAAQLAIEPPPQATAFMFVPVPAGFELSGAWRDDSGAGHQDIPGWGEVWATDGATATGGSWFSVTLLNHPFDTVSANATRVDLGGRVGMLERADDGTWRLTAPVGHSDRNQVLTVRSSGRSTDALIALFQSIGVDDDRPQVADDRPQYFDPTQLEGFSMVASRSTGQDLIDAYLAVAGMVTTTYANATGASYITVDTVPFEADLEALERLAVGPARIFPTSAALPSTFSGKDLVLGASPSGPDSQLLARWVDGDTTVVVRTNLPLGDVLDLLPSLRRTSAEGWSTARRQAGPARVPAGGGTPFAGGDLADGSTWTATVQPPDRAVVQVDDRMVMIPMPDGTHTHGPIHVSTFPTQTIVTAITTSDTSATTLRVVAGGRIIEQVAMIDVTASDRRSSFSGTAAGLAFAQTGPFEVDLLDSSGQLLDHFSSPAFST